MASTGYVRNHGTWVGDVVSNMYGDIYNDGAGVCVDRQRADQ